MHNTNFPSTALQVALDGVSVDFINPDVKLPKAAEQEMQWWVHLLLSKTVETLTVGQCT